MAETVALTVAAYDQIAGAYADFWSDRRVMARALALFCSLLSAGALVLDAGCGPGFDGALLRERGLQVVGLDRSPAMLRLGRHRYPGPYVQGDLRRLPLASGSLNGIWASASLLHLPRADFAPALHGCWHVLQPGGLLYLSLKEGEGEQWRPNAYGQEAARFFTYWQAQALDDVLAAAGFVPVAAWRDAAGSQGWLNRIARRSAA